MTILPGDGSCSGASTPVPCKRTKLSLKYHNSVQRYTLDSTVTPTFTANMDSMTGITAFYPISQRPFKYDPEPSRSSGTDESPASEATSSSERNTSPSVIATVANLGNTCFLNSVLYTLRFAPQFMHQLHHLVLELSSLRAVSSNALTRPQRTQLTMERLHELYQALRGIEESKDVPFEPIQPSVFFSAFREVNPMFETHQQHDAHELLVALLDNVRDTCLQLKEARELKQQQQQQQQQQSSSSEPEQRTTRSGLKWGKNGKKRKSKTKGEVKEEPQVSVTPPPPPVVPADPNFITQDFEGVTVLRTTCLECETATERKETFCDICVPIGIPEIEEGSNPLTESELFHEVLLKSEHISGVNKYWCEECHHYNEARRTIKYETVPRILILQLKRFSSSSMFTVSKVNDFMPTPLTLACFCETCKERTATQHGMKGEASEIKQEFSDLSQHEENSSMHTYQLFAAIMHLGATMASGHYVSFVRATDNVSDYYTCERHQALLKAASTASASSSSSGKIRNFFKPIKTEKLNHSSLGANVCRGADCCGVRLALEQGVDAAVPEASWLECDDDNVTAMTKAEFEDLLSQKRAKYSSLTPYLLFYARTP